MIPHDYDSLAFANKLCERATALRASLPPRVTQAVSAAHPAPLIQCNNENCICDTALYWSVQYFPPHPDREHPKPNTLRGSLQGCKPRLGLLESTVRWTVRPRTPLCDSRAELETSLDPGVTWSACQHILFVEVMVKPEGHICSLALAGRGRGHTVYIRPFATSADWPYQPIGGISRLILAGHSSKRGCGGGAQDLKRKPGWGEGVVS